MADNIVRRLQIEHPWLCGVCHFFIPVFAGLFNPLWTNAGAAGYSGLQALKTIVCDDRRQNVVLPAAMDFEFPIEITIILRPFVIVPKAVSPDKKKQPFFAVSPDATLDVSYTVDRRNDGEGRVHCQAEIILWKVA